MKKSSLILLFASFFSILVLISPTPTQAQATPDAPILYTPTDGTNIAATLTGGKATPTFTWSLVDGPIGEWRIRIWKADLSVDFRKTLDKATYGEAYTLLATEALGFGDYQWRIRGRFAGETSWGPWSAISSFSIIPKAPTLFSPVDNATIFENTPFAPTFSWSNVPGNISQWRFWIYQTGLDVRYYVPREQSSGFTLPNPLTTIGVHCWRVRGQGIDGSWGFWSEEFCFSLKPPDTPTPTDIPRTATATPTNTNTPLPTSTNTPLPTSTNTPLPTSTYTPLPTATNTPLPTSTNTPLPTNTNTPLPTATNTSGPSPTPFPTNTDLPSDTPTHTPTATLVPCTDIAADVLDDGIVDIDDGNVEGLRCAINTANTVGFPVLINLAPDGTYTVEDAYNSTNNAFPVIDNTTLETSNTITIDGHNATVVRPDGFPDFRFFSIAPNENLILENLTMQNGNGGSSDNGGSIYADNGNVYLSDVTIENTMIPRGGFYGGAISNGGGVTIVEHSILRNITIGGYGYGGAIHQDGGSLIVEGSEFDTVKIDNGGTGSYGLAIFLFGSKYSFINNSRFSNIEFLGTDSVGSAAIHVWGTPIKFSNNTFTGNRVSQGTVLVTYNDIETTDIINNAFLGNHLDGHETLTGRDGAVINASSAGARVSIHYNCFENNTVEPLDRHAVFNPDSTPLLDATYNWWGGGAPPVTGTDSANESVDSSNYLTTRPDICTGNEYIDTTLTVYARTAQDYGISLNGTGVVAGVENVPSEEVLVGLPLWDAPEGNYVGGPTGVEITDAVDTRVRVWSIEGLYDLLSGTASQREGKKQYIKIGLATTSSIIPESSQSLIPEVPSDDDGIYWYTWSDVDDVAGLSVPLPDPDTNNNYDIGLTVFLCQDPEATNLWESGSGFSLPTCGGKDLSVTYQWADNYETEVSLTNSRVVVDVDGLDMQAFIDSTNTANFALPSDDPVNSIQTQMIEVAGIDPSIADQVGIAIEDANAGGQTFSGQGFSVPVPAGVTWYALSDADNLNHLTSLSFTDDGTTISASATVYLCHINSGGTASALPTIAIMFLFTSGSLGVLGIAAERKRTRMAAWLLAIVLLGGAGVILGMDTVTVEAATLDPNDLPDCPAQQEPTPSPFPTNTKEPPTPFPTNTPLPSNTPTSTPVQCTLKATDDSPVFGDFMSAIYYRQSDGTLVPIPPELNHIDDVVMDAEIPFEGYLEGDYQAYPNIDPPYPMIAKVRLANGTEGWVYTNNFIQGSTWNQSCGNLTIAQSSLSIPIQYLPPDNIPTTPTGCTIISGIVAVYRGPSDDDLVVAPDFDFGTTNEDILAIARDENQVYWYGIEIAVRSGYLSWVKSTATLTLNNSSNCTDQNLVSTVLRNTQPDYYWGHGSTVVGITHFPILNQETGSTIYGFGRVGTQYSTYGQCRHPGLDFYPSYNTQNPDPSLNRDLYSLSDGIVVGMGQNSERNTLKFPADWGATQTDAQESYNLVIRHGAYFVLYGHLDSIDQGLYYGARVTAGQYLGVIGGNTVNNSDDTHVHIEVRVFSSATNVSGSIMKRFGAIIRNTGQIPEFAIDPIYFSSVNGGTAGIPMLTTVCATNDYSKTTYTSAQIGSTSFSYEADNNYHQGCMNITTGNLTGSADSCWTRQP